MVSAGCRAEGFAVLLAVMTEANDKQGDWPGLVTPNFTTGSSIYARVFRQRVPVPLRTDNQLPAQTTPTVKGQRLV